MTQLLKRCAFVILIALVSGCDDPPDRQVTQARGASVAKPMAQAAKPMAQAAKLMAPPPPPPPAPAFASMRSSAYSNDSITQESAGPKLAYRHQLALEMPRASVNPRFERARDRCLNDATLQCVVLQATIDLGQPYASLEIRLPHTSVKPFEQDMLAPLPDEKPGDAVLRTRSTTAQDLTQAIGDSERQLAQLTDYRDRLAALLKRADAKVDDLIRIEAELSTTQSSIDLLSQQKKQLEQRVATEIMDINFNAQASLDDPQSPIGQVWHDGTRLLNQSAANILRIAIQLVPWAPVLLVGLVGLFGLRRLIKRRRNVIS